LLLTRPGSDIVLVSPWVEDVILRPPLFGTKEHAYTRPEIRLSELLLRLARDYGMRIHLIVRERDGRLAGAIRPLLREKAESLHVREVPHLHAKLVVTEAFVLETSANLLRTSLFRNVELCRLVANPLENPKRLIREELEITL
jgi:hypothetical protein